MPPTATAKKPADQAEQPKRPSLFKLEQDQQALYDILTEIGGDVTEESTAAAIDGWMVELKKGRDDKFDAYAQVLNKLTLDASVATAEAERYQQLARVRSAAAQRLKDRLKRHMELMGETKVETQHHVFAIQKNGGAQGVDVTDLAAVPEEFIEHKPFAKTDEIRKALQEGRDVPGAALKPVGTHLRIR